MRRDRRVYTKELIARATDSDRDSSVVGSWAEEQLRGLEVPVAFGGCCPRDHAAGETGTVWN